MGGSGKVRRGKLATRFEDDVSLIWLVSGRIYRFLGGFWLNEIMS